MAEATPAPVIALVRDLMFAGRIRAIAREAGTAVRFVRDPASLTPDLPGRRVIVDLNLEGATEAAAAWARSTGRPAVGFVQHVDTDRIRAARAAGLDQIVPRSRFDATLPEWLA